MKKYRNEMKQNHDAKYKNLQLTHKYEDEFYYNIIHTKYLTLVCYRAYANIKLKYFWSLKRVQIEIWNRFIFKT